MSLAEQLWIGAPLIITAVFGIILLMCEVFLKAEWPRAFVTSVALVLSIFSLLLSYPEFAPESVIFGGFYFADGFGFFLSLLILVASLVVLMLGAESLKKEGVRESGEFYALYLFSIFGALLFVNSADFLMMFLALETMSLSLYCLCGSATDSGRSAESALKYFFLGSFSSAFLLFGISILYGLTGSFSIESVGLVLQSKDGLAGLLAIGLVMVGLVFKLGAVPFHFWAPDVYEGAPTTITVYMACIIKTAAVGATLRAFWMAFGEELVLWSGAIWTVSILTMVVGNLIALRQRSVKRMLAYSSIAHVGYLLAAFLVPETELSGGAAILYYLVAYSLATLGAFGVLIALPGSVDAPDDITNFNGLAERNPFLAAMMGLFLLSLAGVPPGMVGLLGKVYVFSAAISGGYVGLAIVGVLSSAVSCYYYLRVIVAMYFIDPDGSQRKPLADPALVAKTALVACAVCVVLVGLFPSGLYEFALEVAESF